MKLSSIFSLGYVASLAWAIEINVDDKVSIINATAQVSQKLRDLYPDKEPWFKAGEFGLIQTPDGKNNKGYYWWEAGAAMGAWIDYWSYTDDDSNNKIVTEGLLNQVGPDKDYQPPEQTLSLGNDDQAFWAIAAMAAAERGFPNPPDDKPQWLALAQAVFNRQVSRWDTEACKGGLRWQVVHSNPGYDYKNSVSNGLLFQLGARLARYTGNETYAHWSLKSYDWCKEIGLITENFRVFDGAHIPECAISSKILWSYNAGIFISGCAYMYDYYKTMGDTPNADKWFKNYEGFLKATDIPFFNKDPKFPGAELVMFESACETAGKDEQPTCNTDQRSFKGYLARFMSHGYQLVPDPELRKFIMERLKASARAAAKSCDGLDDKSTCGLSWRKQTYDGSPYGIAKGGVGEHMAVMELFGALLVEDLSGQKNSTTGTSKGDPSAGSSSSTLTADDLMQTEPSTTADRAGAGILTTICLGALLGLTYWLIRE